MRPLFQKLGQSHKESVEYANISRPYRSNKSVTTCVVFAQAISFKMMDGFCSGFLIVVVTSDDAICLIGVSVIVRTIWHILHPISSVDHVGRRVSRLERPLLKRFYLDS